MGRTNHMIRRRKPILRRPVKLKRTPLKKASRKRLVALKSYSTQRKAFLALHPYCQIALKLAGVAESVVIAAGGWYQDVWGKARQAPKATDIHHVWGRGKYLLDETTWLAVCRENHERVHQNPSWARERGYLK